MAKFLSVYESMNRKRSLVHPNYHRLAVEQDGSYSYEIRSFQAETSSSRDEPLPPRPVHVPRSSVPLPSSSTDEASPETDGRISVHNPIVSLYLDRLIRMMWDGKLPPSPPSLRDSYPPDFVSKQPVGIARAKHVNMVLGLKKQLTVRECECVFALAALGVFYDPTHPGHRAIWNKRMWEHTAKTVQKVCCDITPCPVVPPVRCFGALYMRKYYEDNLMPKEPRETRTKEPATRPSASGLHSGSGSTSAGSAPAAPQMSAKALGKRKASDAELPDRDSVGKGKTLPTKPTQRTGGRVALIKRKTTRHSPRVTSPLSPYARRPTVRVRVDAAATSPLRFARPVPPRLLPRPAPPPSNSTPTPSSCSSHAESQSGSTSTLQVVANEMPAPTCSSSSSEVTSEAAAVSEDRERNEPSMKALGKRKAADEDPSATPGGAVQEAGTPPAKRARVST